MTSEWIIVSKASIDKPHKQANKRLAHQEPICIIQYVPFIMAKRSKAHLRLFFCYPSCSWKRNPSQLHCNIVVALWPSLPSGLWFDLQSIKALDIVSVDCMMNESSSTKKQQTRAQIKFHWETNATSNTKRTTGLWKWAFVRRAIYCNVWGSVKSLVFWFRRWGRRIWEEESEKNEMHYWFETRNTISNAPLGSENELSPGGRFIAMFAALSNR
jgi:hypothetical protein